MKKKWLALIMTAMLTTSAMTPMVYAEDIEDFSSVEAEGEVPADAEVYTDVDDDSENMQTELPEAVDEEEFNSTDIEDTEENQVLITENEDAEFTDTEAFTSGEDLTSEELIETFSAGTTDNDAPYSGIDKLENGTYTVTANVYVPGEQNKVLKDVNAFLTNPKYPFGTGANLLLTP